MMRSCGMGFGFHCLKLCYILAILDAGSRLIFFSPRIGICSAVLLEKELQHEERPLESSRVLGAPASLSKDNTIYRISKVNPTPTSSVLDERGPLPKHDANWQKSTVYTTTDASKPESLPPLPDIDVFYSYPSESKDASTSGLTGATGKEVQSIKAKQVYPYTETPTPETPRWLNVGAPRKTEHAKHIVENHDSTFGPAETTGEKVPSSKFKANYEYRPETNSMSTIGRAIKINKSKDVFYSERMPIDLNGLLREFEKVKSLHEAAEPGHNPHLPEVEFKLDHVLEEIQKSEALPLHSIAYPKSRAMPGGKEAENVAAKVIEQIPITMNTNSVFDTLKECLFLLQKPNPGTGVSAREENHERMVFYVLSYLFKRSDIEHQNIINLLQNADMMRYMVLHIRGSIMPLTFLGGYELQRSWKSTFMNHPKLKHLRSLLEGLDTDHWGRVLCTFLVEHYQESLMQQRKLSSPVKETLQKFSTLRGLLSSGETVKDKLSHSLVDQVVRLFASPGGLTTDRNVATYVAAYHLLDYVFQYASEELLQRFKLDKYIQTNRNYKNMKEILDLAERVRVQYYNIRTIEHLQRLIKSTQTTLSKMAVSPGSGKRHMALQTQYYGVADIVKQKIELEARYSSFFSNGIIVQQDLKDRCNRYRDVRRGTTQEIEMIILDYLSRKFEVPARSFSQNFR